MKRKYMPYCSDFLTDIKQTKCIAIIAAMEIEESAIIEGLDYKEQTIGNKSKYSIKEIPFGERTILVTRSGVGLVNAAALLTLLCEHYPIDSIILLGVGGALEPNLKIGDTVVANQVIQHDSLSSPGDEKLLVAPGELTISAPADQQVDPIMRCDRVLTEWLYNIFKKNQENGSVVKGTILSGSEFVANSQRKLEIGKMDKDALLVEMEAAALCQIARKLKIPIGIAKTVVDRLHPQKAVYDDYKTFLSFAAKHSKTVIENLKTL